MSGRARDDSGDVELVAAVARSEEAALVALNERYREPVRGFALRIVGTPERADEVVNDTMLAIWNGAERFEGRAKVSTWIFGIAYRLAHKAVRTTAIERASVALEESAPLADRSAPGQEAQVFGEQVRAALGALPVELRTVVELTYYYGYSVADAAEVTGVPAGTVKSRMHAARKRLRAALGGGGGANGPAGAGG